MTVMTDPMTAARGILTLLSETVPESDLTLARETLEFGYPRLAVSCGISAAHKANASVSEHIRHLVIHEFSWPEDELADVLNELEHIPLRAA